jgi:hypothetical protein
MDRESTSAEIADLAMDAQKFLESARGKLAEALGVAVAGDDVTGDQAALKDLTREVESTIERISDLMQ